MSRLFTASNAAGAEVVDVEAKRKWTRVLSVDIDHGIVKIANEPTRLVGDEIDSYVVRYRSIYPIYGGRLTPCLFHCYGRLA